MASRYLVGKGRADYGFLSVFQRSLLTRFTPQGRAHCHLLELRVNGKNDLPANVSPAAC
jgi:hypothetical protein